MKPEPMSIRRGPRSRPRVITALFDTGSEEGLKIAYPEHFKRMTRRMLFVYSVGR